MESNQIMKDMKGIFNCVVHTKKEVTFKVQPPESRDKNFYILKIPGIGTFKARKLLPTELRSQFKNSNHIAAGNDFYIIQQQI